MLEVILVLHLGLMIVYGAVLFTSDVQVTSAQVPVVTTAETLVAVGFPVTLPSQTGKAVVRGWLDLTVGTGTTAVIISIRRGSVLGGPLLGNKTVQAGVFTPGATARFDVEFTDTITNTSGAQYCLTVTQTGATANGTVLDGLIDTRMLSG